VEPRLFNALERRDAAEIRDQAYLLPALVASSVALSIITAVWERMTFQRRWREWLTAHLLALWLGNDSYRRLDASAGEPQLAEYRIAEDGRVATDAPIDLVVGLLAGMQTAATFVVVLWTAGGSLDVAVGAVAMEVPGYLVFASIAYAALTTGAMMVVGRRFDRAQEPGGIGAEIRRGADARCHVKDSAWEARVAAIRERLKLLSNREREVLNGLVAGKPNRTIANYLGISARMVEVYRANAMTKMQADSLSDLVRMAFPGERQRLTGTGRSTCVRSRCSCRQLANCQYVPPRLKPCLW